MSCFYRIGVAFLLLSGMVFAQTTSPVDQETIRVLVQQVKELQAKVAALEGKQAPVSATIAEARPDNSTQQPQEATSAAQESLFREAHEIRGIQWRGFGEVNYKILNQRQPELGTFGFVPGSAGNFYVEISICI